MSTARQARGALHHWAPELMATGLLRLVEDGHDDRGRKSWWFSFDVTEDNGTMIRLGDGYVHADGLVEGLYGVEFTLEEYEEHQSKCVPSATGGRGDHCASTCECECHRALSSPVDKEPQR